VCVCVCVYVLTRMACGALKLSMSLLPTQGAVVVLPQGPVDEGELAELLCVCVYVCVCVSECVIG
jgi:hypothetical protein